MATEVVRRRGFFSGWDRVTWSGVFAGLVIMLVTQVLLTVLGMAIGLSALEPDRTVPGTRLSWVAVGWAIVSLALALFAGGYVAGRFAPTGSRANGAMNGALVWALSFVLGIYLVGSGVSLLASGVYSAVDRTQNGSASQDALRALAERAGVDLAEIERQVQSSANRAADTTREAQSGDPTATAAVKQQADRAADSAAAGAWVFLIGSVLGLIIASWAGAMGHDRGMAIDVTR